MTYQMIPEDQRRIPLTVSDIDLMRQNLVDSLIDEKPLDKNKRSTIDINWLGAKIQEDSPDFMSWPGEPLFSQLCRSIRGLRHDKWRKNFNRVILIKPPGLGGFRRRITFYRPRFLYIRSFEIHHQIQKFL